MKMDSKTFRIFILVCCAIKVNPCILLLDGWTPLAPGLRAQLAEVVITGSVLERYYTSVNGDVTNHGNSLEYIINNSKREELTDIGNRKDELLSLQGDDPDSSNDVNTVLVEEEENPAPPQTYAARVRVESILKGFHVMQTLGIEKHDTISITNFGTRVACYSDVLVGGSYVMFLTQYQGSLSAKYDDIFGATATNDQDTVEEILEALGWTSWSPWGPCSRSCGSGEQVKYRNCFQESCDGPDTDVRECNSYLCTGVYSIFDIVDDEVQQNATDSSFVIPQNIDTASLYNSLQAIDYSIIFQYNITDHGEFDVLTITDNNHNVLIAIKFTHNGLLAQVRSHNGFQPYDFENGNTISVAFSVRQNTARCYINCCLKEEFSLDNNNLPPLYETYQQPFSLHVSDPSVRGLHGLLFVTDSDAARQQCQCEHLTTPSVHLTTPSVHTTDVTSPSSSPTMTPENLILPDLPLKPVYCKRGCHNGGTCIRKGRCACLPGYFGKRCHRVQCRPRCKNGGFCRTPNDCTCLEGYTGILCQQPICDMPCQHGGQCVSPGVCSCPFGYSPPDCHPSCLTECFNGGTCIGFGFCKCPNGFGGAQCEKVICSPSCLHGGECLTPGICICTSGWTGSRCETPICNPPCFNGGHCILPYFCQCPAYTYGVNCEQFLCSPVCQNGGRCVAPNICTCAEGFTGPYCQTVACTEISCSNGGTCGADGVCACVEGYSGAQCNIQSCLYERIIETVNKPKRFRSYKQYQYSCGENNEQLCIGLRPAIRIVHRKCVRAIYRCV